MILGTGGTIAGLGEQSGGGVGYQAGQVNVAALLQSAVVDASEYHLEPVQVAQVDSKDMGVDVWLPLLQACAQALARSDVAGVVVTHGTDTLEESAWLLQCVLQPVKPVVLTCAMRPANALSADGPANLRDAISGVVQGRSGVWLVAAGQVHAAQHVHKSHPYCLQAFDSGEFGPAGWIEEGRVRWAGPLMDGWQDAAVKPMPWAYAPSTAKLAWPWVEIVTSVAAARGAAVDALVAAGVQGLVVACTGNGSVHAELAAALRRAQSQGVQVVRTTRCEMGRIVLGQDQHAQDVSGLSPYKARISLMLQLLQAQVGAP